MEGEEAGRERIQLAILDLAKGSAAKVWTYLEAAETDFRDVLLWQAYERGEIPKPTVKETLASLRHLADAKLIDEDKYGEIAADISRKFPTQADDADRDA